jgi:5-methylcytosine-specific restriction endonuclease McrA
MLEYLSEHPCTDCGECDPIVLELDHRDPKTKSFGISKSASLGKTIQELAAELMKCEVVCANCHKKRTAHQFGWYKAVL